jgi:hypothetical protein
MRGGVGRQGVHVLLHAAVLYLVKVSGVSLLNSGDKSARAGRISAVYPWIVFHDISARRQRKVRKHSLRIERHDRKRVPTTA